MLPSVSSHIRGVSQSKLFYYSILLYSSPNSVMVNIKLETQRLDQDERRRKHLITELTVTNMSNYTLKLTSTTPLYKTQPRIKKQRQVTIKVQ